MKWPVFIREQTTPQASFSLEVVSRRICGFFLSRVRIRTYTAKLAAGTLATSTASAALGAIDPSSASRISCTACLSPSAYPQACICLANASAFSHSAFASSNRPSLHRSAHTLIRIFSLSLKSLWLSVRSHHRFAYNYVFVAHNGFEILQRHPPNATPGRIFSPYVRLTPHPSPPSFQSHENNRVTPEKWPKSASFIKIPGISSSAPTSKKSPSTRHR